MRIEIPSRRFFTILAIIFALLLIGGAFAVYDPTKGSHDTLWTDRIEPKTGAKIVVAGDMEVTGTLTASIPGSQAPPPATTVTLIDCSWTGWSNDGSCPSSGGNSCSCTRTGALRSYCSGGKVTQMDNQGCLDCWCSSVS